MKNKIIGKPEINMILGMSQKEATDHLTKHGYTMRPINIDGTPLMSTTDVNTKRVNVFVVNDKINDILNIG